MSGYDPGDDRFRLVADTEAARRAAAALFETVVRSLEPFLPVTAEIRHVGATAVPGCATKGDLDVVVRVATGDFGSVEATLARQFARNAGSVRTADFAAFEDAARLPHLGIQLTRKGGRFDVFHLFVEALRAGPSDVQRYNALKRAFDGRAMSEYRAAKDTFIAQVLGARSHADAVASGR